MPDLVILLVTLLHSEKPRLHSLAILSARGLNVVIVEVSSCVIMEVVADDTDSNQTAHVVQSNQGL